MVQMMAVVNLTPDSFYEPSRVWSDDPGVALARIRQLIADGADIIDLGAVSTRPGAKAVSVKEEWRRLEPVLTALAAMAGNPTAETTGPAAPGDLAEANGARRFPRISIDTTRAIIVKRAHKIIGDFIVNDVSAGEDDRDMLKTVAKLDLTYVAMHKRGGPGTMDSLCDYPDGIMPELLRYFNVFSRCAEELGISDWILDPGLGFAKTEAQNWEILEKLERLKVFGRPILVGAADKRFTHGDTARANDLAVANGADILRVHELAARR